MNNDLEALQTAVALEKQTLTDVSLLEDMAREARKAASARLSELRRELERAERRLAEPRVTDHALLRYLERVRGIDMEEVKQAILTPQVREWLHLFPEGNFPLDDGQHKVVIRDGAVLTVKPNKPVKPPRKVTRDEWEDAEAEEAEKQIAEYLETREVPHACNFETSPGQTYQSNTVPAQANAGV